MEFPGSDINEIGYNFSYVVPQLLAVGRLGIVFWREPPENHPNVLGVAFSVMGVTDRNETDRNETDRKPDCKKQNCVFVAKNAF